MLLKSERIQNITEKEAARKTKTLNYFVSNLYKDGMKEGRSSRQLFA